MEAHEEFVKRRIREGLSESPEWDMAKLSRSIGKSHSYIQQYLERSVPQRLNGDIRREIAFLLFKDRAALEDPSNYGQQGALSRALRGVLSDSGVPVYGYASGANACVTINEGSIIERIPDRVPGMGNDGFYLIVSGDSMELVFEQGDKLAVSRALPPRKGRYCVIEFIDSTAAVKRFVGRTDKELVCEQLNPKKTLKFNMNEVVNIYAVVGHVF